MSKRKDMEYFASRAIEERARSVHGKDKRISAAHTEMAERYEQLAARVSGSGRGLQVVSEENEID